MPKIAWMVISVEASTQHRVVPNSCVGSCTATNKSGGGGANEIAHSAPLVAMACLHRINFAEECIARVKNRCSGDLLSLNRAQSYLASQKLIPAVINPDDAIISQSTSCLLYT